jgi:quinol monooxygenase YgiN
MIHVIAIITAHSGKRTELLELFQAVIPVVREERGCIEYGVAVDVPNADPAFGGDTYVVVEKWESLEALKSPQRRAAYEVLRRGGKEPDRQARRTRARAGLAIISSLFGPALRF